MKMPKEWATWKLEECCDILDSKRIPVNSEDREKRIGDIPYYGANGLQGYIDDFIFDEPLILIAEDGGRFDEFATKPIAYRIEGKSWVNNHAHVLRGKAGFSQDAIFYALEHKDIQPFIVGGTRAKLNQSALRSITIELPEQEAEQSKIAEVLSKVDQAIEQTERLIVKQQRIKTGLIQDLLTRGIDEHGNLRSEKTHEFKDSPLGRIPVEWVCSLLSYFVPSAEYGISTSLVDFGTPVLRMNNFSEGEADVSDLKYTELMPPEKLWLRDGDVLFNRTNSWEHVGRTGIWRCQIEKATFASYLVRLNPDPDKLLSELLNIWLNWESTQIAMRRAATPAVQQVNINPSNLRSIYAAFPTCLHEQGEIEKRLACMRKTISSNVEGLAKLRSLKTALMQDLLTGKVRVTSLLEDK